MQAFSDAGLHINAEKSVLTPCKSIECLGFLLNTELGIFTITDKRWHGLQHTLQTLLHATGNVRAKQVAKLTSYIASCKLVLGERARFHARKLYYFIKEVAGNKKWHWNVTIHAEVCAELTFWASLPRSTYSAPMWRHPSEVALEIYSDASASGWGTTCNGTQTAKGMFTKDMAMTGSGHCELHAILCAVQSFRATATNRHVTIY